MSGFPRCTFQWFALLVLAITSAIARADDWPQWLGPQRDGVWRETGIVEKFPANGLPVRWRKPIQGGYSGPAVAKGRLYVMDRQLTPDTKNPKNPFDRGIIPGRERVLCLDELTGELAWQHNYDCPYTVSYASGPRTTPLVADGRVYTLGAEGNLFCLEADNGKVVWSKDFKKEFNMKTPMWGFSAHPLLDGDKLICLAGGNGSTVVAFNKNSGQEIWRALSAKEPGYCPPTLITVDGRRQLIVWHPEAVNGLDPENGKAHWTYPAEIRSGMSISTPRSVDDRLFLTSFYNGSIMLRLDPSLANPTVLWKSSKASETDTTELHSVMSTPFIDGEHIYGVCSYGQLRCLKAKTGERVWETLSVTTRDNKPARWATAFLIKHEKRYFLFNELGDLIVAELSPTGYREISRVHLIEPTNPDAFRKVVWSHPAFASKNIYVRNDQEIASFSLAEVEPSPVR